MYKTVSEARSSNHCCRGKAVSIKYYEFLYVYLPSSSIMPRTCAVLYGHLWPAQLYHIFPHYLINMTVFGKQLQNTKCVF